MKDVDRRLLELAAHHDHIVGLEQVRAVGMTRRQWQYRVRSGLWVPVGEGSWRHVATPETFDMRVRSGIRTLGRDAALTGAAAAAWWGLDGFAETGEAVLFIVPRDRRWRTSEDVMSTSDWCRSDIVWRRGIRVTTVTRLILDLAEVGEHPRRIESAIDSGIRLRLTSLPTLRRRLAEPGRRGHEGTPMLRELLLDAGGESALERRFLRLMRSAGLPRPHTQVTYSRESSRAMRVDFEFPNGLVVEVSGRLGHTADRDRQRDARRRNALQQSGRLVLEFTTADVVVDPDYVVRTLRASLAPDLSARGDRNCHPELTDP